ncbi:MAG: transglycosylase [Desulfobulbaceae bacterium]|nr:MAG: transglycosylase [Desulfobulbaceae bacterium]
MTSTPPPQSPPEKQQNTAKRSARPKSAGKKKTRKKKKKPPINLRHEALRLSLEILGLIFSGVAAIIVLLGYAANRFSGTHFFSSLLPFASGILGLIVLTAILLLGWRRLRAWLKNYSANIPPAIALGMALLAGFFATQDRFTQAFGYYRTLVGGKEEASRVTLAHQVYAAYRRLNTAELQKMIDRAGTYRAVIDEAAAAFGIDDDLLQGLAATESSFLPRESIDGGNGLFQITRVPATVTAAAEKFFPPDGRLLTDPRYNSFLGAATLKHYLAEMKDDLFLGLLAYNIGPKNGGLRFIMQQYGATDFITIQPYLQQLPRDYPIRVLSYSLAFRIHEKEGRLLAYEEGKNALRIQSLGIPGLVEEIRK